MKEITPLNSKSFIFFAFEIIIFLILMGFYTHHSLLISDHSKLYSLALPPRLQTNAFLEGKLPLSSQPFFFRRDLIWTERGLHQNWGLGVPLLRLPFEWLSKQCGLGPFPDRLTLFFYLGLTILFIDIALIMIFKSLGMGLNNPVGLIIRWYLIAWILFCPGISGLTLFKFDVYHETVFYGCMYGLILLSLFWIYLQGAYRHRFFLAICLFCGLAWLVRPTLIFYGLATVICVMTVTYQNSRNVLLIAGGLFVFLLGAFINLWMNDLRFGNIFEFGSSEAMSGWSNLDFVSRFGYTFYKEPLWGTVKELTGALFFNNTWLTHTFRLRERPFDVFNVSHLMICLTGLVLLVCLLLIKPLKQYVCSIKDGVKVYQSVCFSLLWGVLCFGMLFMFYSCIPVGITSRYLCDFSMAITAIFISIVLFFMLCVIFYWKRWKKSERILILILILLAGGYSFYLNNRLFLENKKDESKLFVTDKAGIQSLEELFYSPKNIMLPQEFSCRHFYRRQGVKYQFTGWAISSSCRVGSATSFLMPTKRCVVLNYSFNKRQVMALKVKRHLMFLKSVQKKENFNGRYFVTNTEKFCSEDLPANPISLYSVGWIKPEDVGIKHIFIRLNWIKVSND